MSLKPIVPHNPQEKTRSRSGICKKGIHDVTEHFPPHYNQQQFVQILHTENHSHHLQE